MRLFLGLPITGPLLKNTKLLVADLKQHGKMGKIRWSPSPNWHLTLRFIGNADDQMRQKIAEFAKPIAEQFAPFDITSNNLLLLPSKVKPRAIVLSVRLNDPLAELYRALNVAAKQNGLPHDKRPFLPHITLGRWKTTPHSPPQAHFRQEITEQVTQMHLYESTPGENGSVYTPIETFSFEKENR